ncbi:MAG: 4-alpha-glucanotransferase [Thermodesulfobacteriota bacterium]
MTSRSGREMRELRRLALVRGVQTSYFDIRRTRRIPPPETLLAVLRALGEPLETFRDAPDALQRAEESAWNRFCPPVCAAWDGVPAPLALRVPRAAGDSRARIRISLEEGKKLESGCDLSRLPVAAAGKGAAGDCVEKRVPLPWKLPPGCHALRVELRGMRADATVVSAPRRAWSPPETERSGWGVFLPLYALHSRRSPAGGDLTDLRSLADWVEGLGGGAVATLPLLSACAPEPFEPSPYSPCSRLAWNEIYLDVERAPGFAECPEARALLSSASYREEAEGARKSPLVDHRRLLALKRSVLEPLARRFFRDGSDAGEGYRRFLAENPHIEDYSSFRAAWDGRGAPWPAWPSPLRDGILREDDFPAEGKRYHLFVQWALHRQLRELSSGPRKPLYLDLPLGTAYDGYDVWRNRDLFALDASSGAPPDDFFTRGQDWGFPPLHPGRSGDRGHAYFRACLASQMRYAGTVRIDHVMGLHRFFWIPKGAGPGEGTYIRYPAEELYAVACLESNRHGTRVVGEDLGTVPRYVRPAMARHGIRRMFVAQFGMSPKPERALAGIPKGSVAAVNTHDMPPFASFWKGSDIDDRVSLGLLDPAGAVREKALRRKVVEALSEYFRRKGRLPGKAGNPGAERALRAALAHLAESGAETVIVGLEDLWLEPAPQNTPGTWKERSNWVRKCRFSFEEFREMPEVVRVLEEIGRIRVTGPAFGCTIGGCMSNPDRRRR